MLVFVIAASLILAFVITFLNGMNDAANAVSCIIATKVLTPKQAVAWTAFWEFMAFFIFKVSVAKTMGTGIAQEQYITPYVVLCALIGASLWIWLCTRYGLPISSSHALIGGIIGPVWFVHGTAGLVGSGIFIIVLFIVLAPLLGLIFGFILMCIVMALFKNANKRKLDKVFKKLQLLATTAFSLGHGANDAQKTMGIIAILIFTSLQSPEITGWFHNLLSSIYNIDKGFYIPNGIAVACYILMASGILIGGKNVIKTMGSSIIKITPQKGFCAETACATTLIISSIFGIPVSSSHTIIGSIIGVGMTEGVKSISWSTAKRIIWAWALTIPAPLIIAGVLYIILY